MKEITILSGKGGTGKTSVTAALAALAQNAVLCDNDVDAADLHLILNPKIKSKTTFYSAYIARIDSNKCTNCGLCRTHCHFNAIHTNEQVQTYINPYQCEGCRLCERICPAQAIESKQNADNFWYISSTRFGTLVHARMAPGEENSGKLVTEVRKQAKKIAQEINAEFIINDGPPGIGCSAISSITGTDRVLLVIEPTKSGLHDAERLIELVASFNIPMYAVINKYDINLQVSQQIESFLESKQIQLIGKLGFDKQVVEAMVNSQSIVEFNPNSIISTTLNDIWNSLKSA